MEKVDEIENKRNEISNVDKNIQHELFEDDNLVLRKLQDKLEKANQNNNLDKAAMFEARIGRYFETKKDYDAAALYYRKELETQHKRQGGLFFKAHNYKESLNWYKKVLELAREDGNDRQSICKVHQNISIVYLSSNDMESALTHAKKVYNLTTVNDMELHVSSLSNIATCLKSQGKLQEAIDHLNTGASIIHGEKYPQLATCIYNNLGIYYSEMGNVIRAKELFEISLEYAMKCNKKEIEAKALYHLGMISYIIQEMETSKEYFIHSHDLSKECQDYDLLMMNKCTLSLLDLINEDISSSLIRLEMNLNDQKYQPCHQIISQMACNKGLILLAKGKCLEALECHQKDLETSVELHDKYGQARAHRNIAISYLLLHQYEMALDAFTNSLQIFTLLGDKIEMATAYAGMGTSVQHLITAKDVNYISNPQLPIQYFKRQKALGLECENIQHVLHALRNMATSFIVSENHSKAIKAYEEVVSLSERYYEHNLDILGTAYRNLAQTLSSYITFLSSKQTTVLKDTIVELEIQRNDAFQRYRKLFDEKEENLEKNSSSNSISSFKNKQDIPFLSLDHFSSILH